MKKALPVFGEAPDIRCVFEGKGVSLNKGLRH